ncbi:MAG: ammonium transporter [Alphaproteobacteria bacterium]|nr:ammonium transporter [Alphaproteobacteria bacterium]
MKFSMPQVGLMPKVGGLGALASVLLFATPAFAQEFDTGDTAWMLTSTALVLLMTIPGVALFYAGMVRKKNVLATMMQSFTITALVTVIWTIVGYSLAFTEGGAWVGGFSRFLLSGMELDAAHELAGTIPESVFMTFQMTFAIITAALITGAMADRMKFSALLVFITLWSIFVYAPIAHWVWAPGGWLRDYGVLDFAGGTVVHINSGIAALMAAYVLGPRIGYKRENLAPHNVGFTVIGAALLWVGWFGFNAGSSVNADTNAGMAMAVTQIATAAAALAWMFAEWFMAKKPSVLGAASGAVAGLVAITPASGFVTPGSALLIGIIAGVVCYWAVAWLKPRMGYDDSLDVFGVHCIGGITGAILTGVFATAAIGGKGFDGLVDGDSAQIVTQLVGVAATLVWSGAVSLILLLGIKATIGLRVEEMQEREGLDIALHGESIA